MSKKKSMDTAFVGLSQFVIERHEYGESITTIAKSIENSDISYVEAKLLVEKTISAYENGYYHSVQPSFLDIHPYIKEFIYFLGGIALVLIGSIILSLILGVLSAILKVIGLGGLGIFLVKLGEKAAGMLMGILGTVASKETRSIGMLVGCWVGSGLYYWWLFSTL